MTPIEEQTLINLFAESTQTLAILAGIRSDTARRRIARWLKDGHSPGEIRKAIEAANQVRRLKDACGYVAAVLRRNGGL